MTHNIRTPRPDQHDIRDQRPDQHTTPVTNRDGDSTKQCATQATSQGTALYKSRIPPPDQYDLEDDLDKAFDALDGWRPRPADDQTPWLENTVRAGTPTMPGDETYKDMTLPANLTKSHMEFRIDVIGDSMQDAGIDSGDSLTVRMGLQPRDGDIVVASIDDEATTKAFIRDEEDNYWLVPFNSNFKPIMLSDKMNVRIIGVVTEVIKPNPRRSYRECISIVKAAKAGEPPVKAKVATPEMMNKVVIDSQRNGYWKSARAWAVVLAIYQIWGYQGSVREFVDEVSTWPDIDKSSHKCNRDAASKLSQRYLLDKSVERWERNGVPKPYCLLGLRLEHALTEMNGGE